MSMQDWTSVMFSIFILSSLIDFDNKLCGSAKYHKSIMKINIFINRRIRKCFSLRPFYFRKENRSPELIEKTHGLAIRLMVVPRNSALSDQLFVAVVQQSEETSF